MESGLRKSGRYMKIAREAFRRAGVPEDITWLGQVESAWQPEHVHGRRPRACGSSSAALAPQYGLRQTAWVDERNGIEKPTIRVSATPERSGESLQRRLAAGDGRLQHWRRNVDRAISRAGEANFWKIYPYIAQETRNYVPNILAVILIAKNPEKYGFNGIQARCAA